MISTPTGFSQWPGLLLGLLHSLDATAALPPQEEMEQSRYGMPIQGNISLPIVDTHIPASWAKQNLYPRYTSSPGLLMDNVSHPRVMGKPFMYGMPIQGLLSSSIQAIPVCSPIFTPWPGRLMGHASPRLVAA